jgi:hypothetical protein
VAAPRLLNEAIDTSSLTSSAELATVHRIQGVPLYRGVNGLEPRLTLQCPVKRGVGRNHYVVHLVALDDPKLLL